jgi:hypothetical protein
MNFAASSRFLGTVVGSWRFSSTIDGILARKATWSLKELAQAKAAGTVVLSDDDVRAFGPVCEGPWDHNGFLGNYVIGSTSVENGSPGGSPGNATVSAD